MKKFYLLFLCVFGHGVLSAQNIQYTYNGAGNRISKSIVTKTTRGTNPEFLFQDDNNSEMNSEVILSLTDDNLMLFILNYNDTTNCNVQICTADGKVIRKIHVDSPVTNLSTCDDVKGVYLVNVDLNDKKQTWKFVKE